MSQSTSAFDLVVVAGTDADRGVRARVGSDPIVIGRGPGAGLALADPRVSREHAQAVAAEAGVEFALLPQAKRLLLYRGAKVERVLVGLGERLQVGDTVLLVDASSTFEHRSDARTLMTGEAEDVRAALALYALADAMRACFDRESIASAVDGWARMAPVRAREGTVVMIPGPDARLGAEAEEIVVRPTGDAESVVSVTLQTQPRCQMVLRYALEPHRIAESMRRLLVVAGMVVSSRLGAIQRLSGVKQDRDFVRSVAFGASTSFVGESLAAKRLEQRIERLSRADVTVLLVGETGTGKTFVARLLHERGARADGPFRAVNCAAIPESLIEAELFGTEKGAFTGATGSRPGLIEVAAEGTLFLDEIGELSLAGQAKLLRVLEERRFERIGSTKTLEFRAQVVAATNQDLEAMVRAKRFREDLFYRICAHVIEIPPLRERAADIDVLARRFLADLAPARGRRAREFSADALRALRAHRWPGNVRELRNVVDYAVVNTDSTIVEANALPDTLLRSDGEPPSERIAVTLPADHAWLDQKNFEAALAKSGGNITKAATLLGMNRVSLHKRLRRKGA